MQRNDLISHGADRTRCAHATDGMCVACALAPDDDSPPMPSPAEVAAMERDLERSILRDSFADFAVRFWPVVTGMPLVPNIATDAIIAVLQRVADGELTRVAIAVAPGVGKTTLLACYSAWRLARDSGWRAIHGGHAFELAATESRRVRRLVEGDEFRAVFPHVALRTDESSVGHWATTRDGRYIATGVDTALTGRRAHEAVLDDPLNAIDRFSKAARESLWSWFTESLSTRLDGDRAPMIVVQQRLDRDDLIGRLIAAGGWHVVELPAEFPDGTLLAPNVLPREKLDVLKAQIGAAAYSCQFLQHPASDDDATVRRAWWRFHRPSHVAENTPRPLGCNTDVPAVPTPDRYSRVVIACDMTFGAAKGDYAVAGVFGAVGPARYLIELWRKRGATQMEQREAIKALAKKFPTARVLIEKAAGGAGALEIFAADGIRNVFPVLTGGRSKIERLAVVSPAIEAGAVMLPLGAPWLSDYVEELAGASRHDDAMDVTAYALAALASDPVADAQRASMRNTLLLCDYPIETVDAEVERMLAARAARAAGEGVPQPTTVDHMAGFRAVRTRRISGWQPS